MKKPRGSPYTIGSISRISGITAGVNFIDAHPTKTTRIISYHWQAWICCDGGASATLPIDVAIQDSAEIIIAMGFTLSYRNHLRSMTAVQEQLNSIYINHILNATYAFYYLAHRAEIFPILPEFKGPISMFDMDKIPDMIKSGEEATRAELPHIRRLLAG